MPDHIENSELFQAYVLGCLDKCDEKIFEEYLSRLSQMDESAKSKVNKFLEELGKYQNLVALLPVILKTDEPDPKVKDKIARRLYRIRDEIGKKKAKGLIYKESKHEDALHPASVIGSSHQENKMVESINFKQPLEFEKLKLEGRKDLENSIKLGNEGILLYQQNEKLHGAKRDKVLQVKEYDNKRKGWGMIGIIWILVFLTGLAIIYIYFSKEIDDYKDRIIRLNKEKSNLIIQLSELKNFSEILNSKNLVIVDLEGAETFPNAKGKLFIDFSRAKGFLQLTNIHQPNDGTIYQLWMRDDKEFIALSKLEPREKINYNSFQIPNKSSMIGLKFLLTEEPAAGSEKPMGKILLEGSDKP